MKMKLYKMKKPKKTCLMLVCVCALGSAKMQGQVLISTQKSGVAPPAKILLELDAGTVTTGMGLLLPRATSEGMKKLKGSNGDSGTENGPLKVNKHSGLLIYDLEAHTLKGYVKKKDDAMKGEFKDLVSGGNSGGKVGEVIDITKDMLKNGSASSSSSSSSSTESESAKIFTPSDNKVTITVTTPKGYQPCRRNPTTSEIITATPLTAGATVTDSVFVDIAYNGISLNPEEDYTVTLENGMDSTPKNVKIEFKTLLPEEWEGFSRLAVEYCQI